MSAVYLMSPPRIDWGLKGKANFRSAMDLSTDATRARAEWASLADAIVSAGGEVLVCPPDPGRNLTGMIYTAEAGELYLDVAGRPRFILPNMAAAHRQQEADWIGRFVQSLGWETEEIEAVWEAQGDALRAPDGQLIIHTYGVGPSARTQAGAYAQVASRLGGEHVQLEFIADPWFHGNTFLGLYGDQTHQLALVCEAALKATERARLEAALVARDIIWAPISVDDSLGYDTNALQVGRTVLASATLSDSSRARLEALGLKVLTLKLDELFLKGGGAPVCLTNRLWGCSPEMLGPKAQAHLWSLHPSVEHHEALASRIAPG